MQTELPPLSRPLSPWFPCGTTLLHDPGLNKGTAFTAAERDVLGLKGLLPPRVSSQGEQAARVLGNRLRPVEPDLEVRVHRRAGVRIPRRGEGAGRAGDAA